MNSIVKSILYLSILVVLLGLFGCKTQRSALKKPLKEYGFDYLYNKMIENQLEFEYLTSKMSITYIQDKNRTELNGQLRMRNDSLAWVSFSPALGIEAGRLVLTNDSIKFMNRLNKTYFTDKYQLVDSLLNTTIDYSIFQAMLLGNDIAQYDVNKYRSSVDNGLYRITIQERRKLKRFFRRGESDGKVLVQQIWLDPVHFRIRRIDIKELGKESNKLQVFYDDYENIDGQLFPTRVSIEITSQKPISIEIKYFKTILNNPQSYPFRIPKKYDKFL